MSRKGREDAYLLPSKIANQEIPQLVIKFYENCYDVLKPAGQSKSPGPSRYVGPSGAVKRGRGRPPKSARGRE